MTETVVAEPDRGNRMRAVLESAYAEANAIVEDARGNDLVVRLGPSLAASVARLGATKSAARGVALTLAAYKLVEPGQDVRRHKSEHAGGFSARSYDSRITMPFLIKRDLPKHAESHWLSQTFSFAGPYVTGIVLRTQPKMVGPLMVEVVEAAEAGGHDVTYAIVVGLLLEFIKVRNADRVVLTRPKDLPIHKVRELVEAHMAGPYKANAPRLPQLVIYAVYDCLVESMQRYHGAVLEPLERLKSADRKRGTIGDVVVARSGVRIEAVEIKHNQPITLSHVEEAIAKVRAESVTRYYLLSNKGIEQAEAADIQTRAAEFLKQNGCELIINGVVDSLVYYLRLLPNTTEFLFKYAALLETDDDTAYEHRTRWNACCEAI